MLAEAIIIDNEMKIVNFPKGIFIKGNHWKINIEPIEEIIDDVSDNADSVDVFFDKFNIDFSDYRFNRDAANER